MRRRFIAYVILLLAWPCTLVHRLWNNKPINIKYWFLLEPKIGQDIQWYIADTGNMLAIVFILLALLIYTKNVLSENRPIKVMMWGLLIVYIVDIPHYWIWAKHSETILFIQSFILLYCTVKIYFKYYHDGKSDYG